METPAWMTDEGIKTLERGYLLPNETPRVLYRRLASAAATYYPEDPSLEDRFFNMMWRGWLGPASPVLSNLGTDRGLPISCFGNSVGDSVDSIFQKNHELAMLSKNGGGVSLYLGDIRGRGASISGNGQSEGMVPWCRVFDTTTMVVSQGGVRRGASALYLPVTHSDVVEFMGIRRPVGDVDRRCLHTNVAVCITDDWMRSMLGGDVDKRLLWQEILRSRVETGEPYLFFTDAVNEANPECYKDKRLRVVSSNICTEINLFTDEDHTFVCCLSSLNLTKWDEWRDTDTVELSIMFLDAVMQEFIDRSNNRPGLEGARRSAIKGRALGLGVLGWHSLLQERDLPFDSFEAMQLNAQVFKHVHEKAEVATKTLASMKGEPEWCQGHGRRNTHLLAIAPTVSNSAISGGVSAGIEPIAANVFAAKSAKGTFLRKNATLERVLQGLGKDTPETWATINKASGSVKDLEFLTNHQKQVFLTARELNQHAVIRQAAQRQKWIDQGQSINLFFPVNADPKYIHQVHVAAWEQRLKTLYYFRSEGVLKGDSIYRGSDECEACGG